MASGTRRVEVIRGLGVGGAETLLYNRLRRQVLKGETEASALRVYNCHPRSGYFQERLEELGIRVISGPLWMVVPRILRDLRRSRHDGVVEIIVHSPAASIPLKLFKALKLLRADIVDVVHSSRYRPLYRSLSRRLNRFAMVGLFVSPEVGNAPHAQGYKYGSVVLAGVDQSRIVDWVKENTDELLRYRDLSGAGQSARLVSAVGNLLPHKDHASLLCALADSRLSNVVAVIVGEGPERENLEALAGRLGISDRVRLAGRIPDAWRWIAASDLICQPSLWEGLSVTLMEASALNVPVVASDVSGSRLIAEKHDNVVLVEPGNVESIISAIQGVLANIEPFEEALSKRRSAASFWSIDRYITDFNAAILRARST